MIIIWIVEKQSPHVFMRPKVTTLGVANLIDSICLHRCLQRLRSYRCEKAPHRCEAFKYWWPERESNLRHADFQF